MTPTPPKPLGYRQYPTSEEEAVVPFRDPRSFREMWESSSNSERWLVAGSLALLLVGVMILGRLG